jgi:hypothetical protein
VDRLDVLDHPPNKQIWFLKLLIQSVEDFAECAREQTDAAERTRAIDFAAVAHNTALELLGRMSLPPDQKAPFVVKLQRLADAVMSLEQ